MGDSSLSRSAVEQPKRIQRKRTKGWRMPESAVYVGRPTRYGNPYSVKVWGTRERAVGEFRALMRRWGAFRDVVKVELRGKDLVCWCPLDQPCHADVLLELANSSSLLAVSGETREDEQQGSRMDAISERVGNHQ